MKYLQTGKPGACQTAQNGPMLKFLGQNCLESNFNGGHINSPTRFARRGIILYKLRYCSIYWDYRLSINDVTNIWACCNLPRKLCVTKRLNPLLPPPFCVASYYCVFFRRGSFSWFGCPFWGSPTCGSSSKLCQCRLN